MCSFPSDLNGILSGNVTKTVILNTSVVAFNATQDGQLDWRIIFGNAGNADTYFPLLPSLSLPYGWLMASESPPELQDGLELTGNGRFTASVLLNFPSGEELTLQHTSQGLSPQQPGRLIFTSRVSGSHPQDFDATSLIPLTIILTEQTPGNVQGTVTQASVTLNISITYQPADVTTPRPAIGLTLEHQELSSNARQIVFSSVSTVQQVTFGGTLQGSVNSVTVPEGAIRATVDPDVDGRLTWNVSAREQGEAQRYLPFLPALALPASWLTADERPNELRNGLESGGDGQMNATVLLGFPTGEQLQVEVTSINGVTSTQPLLLEYSAQVSGSHPDSFNASQLLPLALPVFEDTAGLLQGEHVLAGNVTISISINYIPINPEASMPALIVRFEQTETQFHNNGRIITFSTHSTLTRADAVQEVQGNLQGTLNEQVLAQTQITATVNASGDGQLNWSIILGDGVQANTYLPILPSLTLPYGWLTASENPSELQDGLELTGNGHFSANVLLNFESGEELALQHTSLGLSPQQPGRLIFTSRVSGSHPQDFDASSLLPLAIVLTEQTPGNVQGTATQASVTLNISITYIPADITAPRPAIGLTLEHQDLSSNARQIVFSSVSTIQQVTFGGTLQGSVNSVTVPEGAIRATVDPDVDGRLTWNVSAREQGEAQRYLPFLPALALPASWLTADERPNELRNGLESGGDGRMNATVLLGFPTGEQLQVEVTSINGVTSTQPLLLEYSAQVSGSHPDSFNASQLLPLALPVFEDTASLLQGEHVLAGNVTISISINYIPINPEASMPALIVRFEQTETQFHNNGRIITFSTHSTLTRADAVQEVQGNLHGTLNEQVLAQTQITATVNASVDGQLNWSIILGDGVQANTYLPILPSLTLPYGWLTASENPSELQDGLELTGNGHFSANVLLNFESGEELTLQHTSLGLSSQQPGRLIFTSRVSGSHPQDFDASSLLPLAIVLTEQTPGNVQGTVTQASVTLNISITYQPADVTTPRPAIGLTLEHQELSSNARQIVFSSVSTVQQVTFGGTLQGSVNSVTVPEGAIRATVDPDVDGRLTWNVSAREQGEAQRYLPFLPALALPASWLTADERPNELRNGLESGGDGQMNATVLLGFPTGEQLQVEVTSINGVTSTQPLLLEYSAQVSGSHPDSFNASQLLPLALPVFEDTAGLLQGEHVLAGNVTISISINYIPINPEASMPALIVRFEQTETQFHNNGRIITFSTHSTLTRADAVQEVQGNLQGTLNEQVLAQTQITATVNASGDGQLNWSIILGDGVQANTYLPILPSLTLPYGWLTASENPSELQDGLELTGNGHFSANVLLNFESGEELALQHTSLGLSPQQPGRLIFTSRVSGSHPQDFDASSLLPLAIVLTEQTPGNVQGTATQASVTLNISITYIPADITAPRPAIGLTLEHQDLSSNARQIVFSSVSTIQQVTFGGTLQGSVNSVTVPEGAIRATVDPDVDGRLTWNVSAREQGEAQRYLPFLPALALPASWLTADERPNELRNGLESGGDGRMNATVLLGFPTGEQLQVEVTSINGVTSTQPLLLEYSAQVSGSHPDSFNASQLLPLALPVFEDTASLLQGEHVLAGNVTISISINYIPINPEASMPALIVRFEQTETQFHNNGRIITFSTHSTLTRADAVQEVQGNLHGTLNEQVLAQTQITATVNASVDGQLNWSIILGDGVQANTYLPILPSLTLPYGWLTASENPSELQDGLELTGNGHFSANVLLNFESGEELTLQHTSLGLSSQQPGRLIFTSRVSGSHPQDFDASSLLPLAIVLTEQTPGNVQGTATQASVTLNISITYIPADITAPRPAIGLTLEHQDLSSNARQIVFSSVSTIQQVTFGGTLQGSVNSVTVPEGAIRATVDPDVDGRLTWNISTREQGEAQGYLPFLPALALPASWLTADERPNELRNGLESGGDGRMNATVLLGFPTGEQLQVEVTSINGVTSTQPLLLEYSAHVSGSNPDSFNASQLLPLALPVFEDTAGLLQGEQVLAGNVTISISINYIPINPEASMPALIVRFEQTETQFHNNGRIITFSTHSTLTRADAVQEVQGNLHGTLNEQVLAQTQITATVNASEDGKLNWSIILGDGVQANTYLPILPSLTLPYGWLTASENPSELQDGLELTGNGHFSANVLLNFESGEELALQHTSLGLSSQQPGHLIFTSRVSGSHPQDFDASSLLPLAIILTEQTPGNVQGTATQASVTLNISITYQPADITPPRPAIGLTLEHQDLSSNARQIVFSSVSTVQQVTFGGTLQGSVNSVTVPEGTIRATVDFNVDGRLTWNISAREQREAQRYLPFLPALALPASWLIADERPNELRNGLESGGDGQMNATVLLGFPTGEQLQVEVTSINGVTSTQPLLLEYSAQVSGSHPDSFNASQLLPLALPVFEDTAGLLQGEQVLAGNVTISISINYIPINPEAARPALIVTFQQTETQFHNNGRIITFSTHSTLTRADAVQEVQGNLHGTLNEQILAQTQITATVNASGDGQLNWSIILGDGVQANTYLPILPSLTLPYGWLSASENPSELQDGLELTGNGHFSANILLNFESGEELTLQHTSLGLSSQQPGRLIFTSRVSGSHPQDFDASSLLPLAIILTEQTPGNVQGTATQASVTLNISITYQPADVTTPRPAIGLTLEHQNLSSNARQIVFSSVSTIQQVTFGGTLQGSVNSVTVPEGAIRATVDPDVDGRLTWNISTREQGEAQGYLPFLPALALPASWLTADERPNELRNGLESGGDGRMNATVLLGFPTGEQLQVEVTSINGVTSTQPLLLEYSAHVSGSNPDSFNASQLLPLALPVFEDTAGLLQGEQVLAGNVTISISINYIPINPEASMPALIVRFEQTETQFHNNGRIITFSTHSTLTRADAVQEVQGNLHGTLNEQVLAQTQITATVNASEDGKLNWSIILGDGVQANTYLPILPSLTLPYGWLTASENPSELQDGLELTGNGHFSANVLLNFESGEELALQHTSLGLSSQQPGHLIFTSRVSGSHPQDFDASSLLPLAIILTEQTPGNVQGTATQASVTLNISITYQPADITPPRPAIGLTLEHQDLSSNARQIVFSSVSTVQQVTFGGTLQGSVNSVTVPEGTIRATVDFNVDGRLTWNISAREQREAQRYLPFLPALALPASWLIADERPNELRNGLESGGDGQMNATVLLGFPTGEQLQVEVTSINGVTSTQPLLLEYSAQVSGSHPDSFNASQLLPLALPVFEDTAGLLQGEQVLAGNVTISISINYIPINPEAARPALIVTFQQTETQFHNNGRIITFSTHSTLTRADAVQEVQGNLHGTLNEQILAQTQITATVNASGDGQLNWSIILGDGVQANTYLPILPSLTLPYGWLSASENPSELQDGLELTGNGHFSANILLNFESGEELTLQHTSLGLSSQQPGRLIFTSRVSGSHPQDFDASSLLPLAIILTEQTPGNVQGTATQASVTLNISITYQPADVTTPRPAIGLTLEHQNLSSNARQIVFSSVSTIQQVTFGGTLQGSVNSVTVPEGTIRATVDPDVGGRLTWNISAREQGEAQGYLPFLPALALPASWFTADERPNELRNGLESGGDGRMNATILLGFPTGEQLQVEVTSINGVTSTQPLLLEYSAQVSGSHPDSFNASQLLPLALPVFEDTAGLLQGEQVLAGNVTISISINYIPINPEASRPALIVRFEQTETQFHNNGRIITFSTHSTLTRADAVQEVQGNLQGTLNEQVLAQTQITATVNASEDGKLNWSIILSDGVQANTYLPILPSLTLPYGWLTASENPSELQDGLELTGNGHFSANVLLNFESGEELALQHTSQGLSPQQPGRLIFTSRVSGSHPQDFDASSLLPLAIILTEQTPGNVQGTATQASVTLNISITYQPADITPPRPAIGLTLEHQDLSSNARQIVFSSVSTVQQVTFGGTLQGSVNSVTVPEGTIRATVDFDVDGRLTWNISAREQREAQRYLPFLPALALPASWLIADERPNELRNGLESGGDGRMNATVLLGFPTGEQLQVEVTSINGVTSTQPLLLEYSAQVSGSHPDSFNASQLLPLALPVFEDTAGLLQGEQVLAGNVTISISINYIPINPEASRPALIVRFEQTETQFHNNGRIITFSTHSTLTRADAVQEVQGNLHGTLNEQILAQTQITATVNASGDGQLNWSIILGDGVQANTYLPILPSLTLPYGWLSASENPSELQDGLELTGNGHFSANILLNFESGEELTLQHTSLGLSSQQPGRLIFTSRVSGSHPQDFDASSLLPLAIILTEQTPGNVQGTATQASVTLNISITYQPADVTTPRPAIGLTLEHQNLSSNARQIVFSSVSTVQQVTFGGTLQGSVNSVTVPEGTIRATVDPDVGGRLTWNISAREQGEAQGYLPFLPVLALPASWLTADERPNELRNGLESGGDGRMNATILLGFPTGEQLQVEVTSINGVTSTQPLLLEYSAQVSGSHPDSFNASQLLPLALPVFEDTAGLLQGEQVLAGNVTISISINYIPINPEASRPALIVRFEQTETQFHNNGRIITFSTHSTLTRADAVQEVQGNLQGTLNEQVLAQTQITATVNASEDGKLNWSIILGDGVQANTYLPILPSLTLPYGWLTASENPSELQDGLELTGNGHFSANVLLNFESGEELALQHTSLGLSSQQPGRLIFTSRVSGSHPQDFDASSLLPLAIILTEQTPGNVQGTATQASVTLNISITYQPADITPPRPAIGLTLEHQDLSSNARQIVFSSVSTVQQVTFGGTLQGSVNSVTVPEGTIRAIVDPDVGGRLTWNISAREQGEAQGYLPFLPALALPASWLTADERPNELRNGLESGGDGRMNATVLLGFPTGEQLQVEVTSINGVTSTQPLLLEYSAQVSGSHPDSFNASQLLPLALPVFEDTAGLLQGEQVLAGNVTISISINYIPINPEASRPALIVRFEQTETQFHNNGRIITFSTHSTLTRADAVQEVQGNLHGTLNEQVLAQTQITASVNASVDGQLDWSIILGDGVQANTYLPILPSLTLPYGWLTASENPSELQDGLELTGNGHFSANILLNFESGEELTLQHTSLGLSSQQPGRLIFTSRVSGSHPQDFDASSLLPLAIVLTEQTPGNVQGTAIQASVTLNISITYEPPSDSAPRPTTILTLEQQGLDTVSRQITFSSISNLHQLTLTGHLEGRVNEDILTTGQITATIDLEVDGQLKWNVTVADGENLQMYLPLLPALVLPASWLTAEEIPEELRDGLESSGNGNLNASVLLSFPSGDNLRVDIFSPGDLTVPVLEYNSRVSGSYPQDFDASQLLKLALSLQEDPAGMLQGQQVLSGNVTISVQINYNPVDPQDPRPALRLTLEQTQTQVSSDGRSITFTTRATLTTPAVVEEVEGSLEGMLNQQPLAQTQISATVNESRDGQLDWSIILGDGAQANTYLPLLPSLTLPYGWLTSLEIPKELLNGLEKTGNGSFNAIVTLSFENGEELTLQHTSQGLSPQQPGRLIFSSRVSGSHPQDFDASSLLPVAIVLTEQTPGNVQGTATQASVTLNISITYQPANASAPRPATILTLEQQDLATDSRQITFNSISTLQHPTIAGGLGGRVNEENLPTSQVRVTVDPELDGQLRWNISVPDGENAQSYLPLLPALALPASWLTAEERPEELRDGFESSGNGNLNATVLVSFPSGEQLRVDIFSPGGVTAAQPPVLEYRARVSGSYQQDFDASQLLRLALSLQEDPAGMLQGQQVLSGNVTISVQINYNPVDLQAPRPALRLALERTQTQVSSDGRSITFNTRSTLTTPPVVEEVEGSLEGTLNQQPLEPTRISATVNESRDGQLDWSIILGDGAQANTYLPLLPSLTLPYGWLTSLEIPKELLNGLEKTGNGSFNAIVTLSFENGEELTLQHTSQGLSPQQPGHLIFTSRVSGSHPQDFDASSLLPVAIVLTEQTPGYVQGTATQASVTLNISITYQPSNASAPRPATILMLEQQDLATDSRQITFNSISTLQHPTIAGGLGGRVNEENLPTSQVRVTVDPEVDGQLRWNISVPDGENAQSYLPLLPALALPASWLTAEERPDELRDGFESSGDGNLNATVLLSFLSGEQLRVDIFSPGGVTAAHPPVLEYRAKVSGSYPQDFDSSQLLRLALSLQEDPAGMLQGQQVLSGNVTISVQINYNPVDPQAPRPTLHLALERTQTQVSSDGRSITFNTHATLTAPAIVEEVEGSLEGTLNQQPLPQARISATVNASQDGQLDWSIILVDGAQANTYLPLLPSLTLPYGWLTASEIPKELLNGLEKTGNGSFNAIVTLSFENGEELILQHTSQGLSPQQPGRLIFTSRVSGSHPQDFDASSLFPLAIILTEQIPGSIQGTVTQGSISVKIRITYQVISANFRPLINLTLHLQDLLISKQEVYFTTISMLVPVINPNVTATPVVAMTSSLSLRPTPVVTPSVSPLCPLVGGKGRACFYKDFFSYV